MNPARWRSVTRQLQLHRCTGQSRQLLRQLHAATPAASAQEFKYEPLWQSECPDPTPYYKLEGSSDYVSTINVDGKEILKVKPEGMAMLSKQAMIDIAHLLRPAHLSQLSTILKDPEASDNDKFVALELLKNANIASSMILPSCQDTGTGICVGKKGQYVWTEGGMSDEEAISKGIFDAYTTSNLRYSQVAPQNFYKEVNTKCNLPAQVELYATEGNEYKFLFMAKGGGSANKTFLYQETKALLNPKSMALFINEKIKTLGTAACPPYHLAFVVGGLSAEMNLKTVKYASAKYLDELPTSGSRGGRAFRDLEMEKQIVQMSRDLGLGAQFGGKYFCHDVRVVRLPRHGASCPVGLGVSCSADRQAKAKITKEGIFLEQLERDVQQYFPDVSENALSGDVLQINLDKPMDRIREMLSICSVSSRLSLTGTLVVARDIAHAKLKIRLENGEGLPDYFKNHIVYYAGPAKTPEGYASGSFGPTTAGRMDSYVDLFQANGGSMVMLAKGNRSRAVTNACKKYGGFYLGSIGGPAANLAANSIKKVEVLDHAEDGMEAIWKIEVENFPAFVVVDDKGNDFFQTWLPN